MGYIHFKSDTGHQVQQDPKHGFNRSTTPLGVVGCKFTNRSEALHQSLTCLVSRSTVILLCNRKVSSSILEAEICFFVHLFAVLSQSLLPFYLSLLLFPQSFLRGITLAFLCKENPSLSLVVLSLRFGPCTSLASERKFETYCSRLSVFSPFERRDRTAK
jgi:hypothetical protein